MWRAITVVVAAAALVATWAAAPPPPSDGDGVDEASDAGWNEPAPRDVRHADRTRRHDPALVPDVADRSRDGSSPTHALARRHHDGRVSPEGFEVAGGGSEAGEGTEVTFTVELEPATDLDLTELVRTVEGALYDPGSWVNENTLRRIDDPAAADIRVVLASPATVDRLCARAGLDTAGLYSCWNGRVAALNSMRWLEGASGFGDDLDAYRRYLVNHEFGHGLGYGHVGCPAPGELAPVMKQQTKGTGDCRPNPWPYPELATDG